MGHNTKYHFLYLQYSTCFRILHNLKETINQRGLQSFIKTIFRFVIFLIIKECQKSGFQINFFILKKCMKNLLLSV